MSFGQLATLSYIKLTVDAGTRHTNTSMCTRGAEGDAPQLTPREADFQRDTQDSKPALLGPDALLAREGPRQGSRRRLAARGRSYRP